MRMNRKRQQSAVHWVSLGWRKVCKRRARKLYKRGEPVIFYPEAQAWLWLPSYTTLEKNHVKTQPVAH